MIVVWLSMLLASPSLAQTAPRQVSAAAGLAVPVGPAGAGAAASALSLLSPGLAAHAPAPFASPGLFLPEAAITPTAAPLPRTSAAPRAALLRFAPRAVSSPPGRRAPRATRGLPAADRGRVHTLFESMRRLQGTDADPEATDRFQAAVQLYLDGLAGVDPEAASYLGIHSGDGVLTAHDSRSRARRDAFYRRVSRALDRIPAERLSREDAVDHLLLSGQMGAGEPEVGTFLTSPLETISMQLTKDYAPVERRAAAALARLEQYPKVLRQGRRQAETAPRIAAEAALEEAAGVRVFLDETQRVLAALLPSEDARIRRAVAASRRELGRFESALRQPRPGGGWAAGRKAVEEALRSHLPQATLDGLRSLAEEQAAATLGELKDLAARLFPGRSWRDAVSAAGRKPLKLEEILDAYRAAIARARRHIADAGIATPPAGEVTVLATPEYLRSSITEAAYDGPLPLGPTRDGQVFVTLPPPGAAPAEVERWLATYGVPEIIDLTALHEATPGHHLQLSRQKEHPAPIRRIFWDYFLGEGWAHYMEGVLADSGFLKDGGRLLMLYERYWQLVRARVAMGLHAEGWSLARGARVLAESLGLDRADAARAARLYALLDPMESMSYALGRLEILRIKGRQKERLGARFSEKQFHDRVLSYGAIPLPLIEAALERDWR
ncbi:MAG: hypothetical protein A2X36_06120 [Elusimicrobia bacterium GWA2_69_24]|nr:MAG: hypothetical protein A2X36_06120 [Elusimicrobia bacterium GWA2_69_24]